MVQELYIRYAEGHIRGLSDLDRDRGCVRLWRGLQGVAAVRMEEADLGRLTAEKAKGELASGWLYFLAQLNEKFPETALRQLPRVYRGFFNDVVWRGDMETLILDIEKAASLLEGSDTDTKVSDGMCGYWTLLRSRLADGEVKHIIGLAGGQLKLSRIRTRLTELYPRGSYKRDGHRSYLADEDESWLADQYGGGWDELDDAWVPDDDGGFYDADEDGLAAWERDSSWQGGSWPESRTTRGRRPWRRPSWRSCTLPATTRTRRSLPRPRRHWMPTTAPRRAVAPFCRRSALSVPRSALAGTRARRAAKAAKSAASAASSPRASARCRTSATRIEEFRDVWTSDDEKDEGLQVQLAPTDTVLILLVKSGGWPEEHWCYPAVRSIGRVRHEPYQ